MRFLSTSLVSVAVACVLWTSGMAAGQVTQSDERPYELTGERLLRSAVHSTAGEAQARVITWRRGERVR
jgi:hypothetical protein